MDGEREPRTDISQVELQLHGLRDAPRRSLHQLRREDRSPDPRVRSGEIAVGAVRWCPPLTSCRPWADAVRMTNPSL